MKNKNKPLYKFRIYGWRSRLYIDVYIWKFYKDIYKQWYKKKENGFHGYCRAFVRTIRRYKVYEDETYRIKPIVGEMHLCIKSLGMEVITHESVHAATRLLDRLKFNYKLLALEDEKVTLEQRISSEEILSYCVGHFAKQIVDKIYKLKILVEATKNK